MSDRVRRVAKCLAKRGSRSHSNAEIADRSPNVFLLLLGEIGLQWDLGRGTVTQAIDVIKGEAGEPTGSYESAYGVILTYVWGVELGDSVSTEKIRQAPFSAAMTRDMVCGDYIPSAIEFYSYGDRIWP